MADIIQFNKLLTVDLTSGRCKFSDFPEAGKAYLGGRGFNVWYLYNHLSMQTNFGSPKNILMISCGFLTGSSAPASARVHINSLSPLTGILGSSNIGGFIGSRLSSCGIASVAIQGKSNHPVYLYIDDSGASIKNAAGLWGADTLRTQEALNAKYPDRKISILTIGPAGEKQVPFSAIVTGKDHAAGRTGMGAVMGMKNLKAIVIARGENRCFAADTPEKKAAVKKYASRIKASAEFDSFSTYGGAGYVNWVNKMGIMGSRNYSQVGIPSTENIDGRKLSEHVVKKSGCYKCPVQCKADIKFDHNGKSEHYTRPEFEPMINFGPKCGLDDLKSIVRLDNLCGRLGLDTTSSAGVIAFAMDLFEKQLLPGDLADGLDLSWGNVETMEKLIYQMVENQGLGKILRLGVKRASEIIKGRASEYAAHVKGLELTAYHPATIMGTALGYAVSSRGGDYNNVYASLEYSWSKAEAEAVFGSTGAVDIKSVEAKGYLIKKAVLANIIIDTMGLCKVPVLSLLKSFNLEPERALINDLSGLNISKETLFGTAKKIAAHEKRFNLRHGKDSLKDELPTMFFNTDNSHSLSCEGFKTMLAEYYRAMGWDEKGIPPEPGDTVEK